MKKFVSILGLAVMVWSCSHKITPSQSNTPSSNSGSVISKGGTSPEVPASTVNTPATTTTTNTGAVAAANSPVNGAKVVERAGAGNDAAAIAGQSTFNAKCGRCHGLKVVSDYTVDRWISIMQVMAMKAALTDTEKENVLAYVKANAKK